MPDPILRSWLVGCAAAHRRLEAVATGIGDDVARRSSRLPGWTVGHVLTHLARNAGSQLRMLRGAQRGTVAEQYPGGTRRRGADIEAGAARPAVDLRADLAETNAALEQAYAETSDEVWQTGLGLMVSGLHESVAELVFRRWREAEVHGVDLGLQDLGGPDWDDLPPSYLDSEWERALAVLQHRIGADLTLVVVPGDRPSRAFGSGPHHVVIRGSTGTIFGWLTGRGGEPGWPGLTPWS